MKGDGLDLFDERLKREKDPKVRDRIRMIILLEEGYKQREVVLKDDVFGMSPKIFDFWDLTTEWSRPRISDSSAQG
jgi:hypothetical protein